MRTALNRAAPGPALPAAVLFDMDGTLVDTEPLWFAAEKDVMGAFGGAWDVADQEACLGGPITHTVDYMARRLSQPPEQSVLLSDLLAAVERRIRTTAVQWQPGARDLLAEVRDLGLGTALVSASWQRIIRAVAEQVSAGSTGTLFDVVVAGDDVASTKPHPEPYLTAAAALGHAPHECLAIEDSDTGIASAVAAGCRVIAVPIPTPSGRVIDRSIPGAAPVPTLAGASVASLWRRAGDAARS